MKKVTPILKVGQRVRVVSTYSCPKHYGVVANRKGKVIQITDVTKKLKQPRQYADVLYGVEIEGVVNQYGHTGYFWFTGWELEKLEAEQTSTGKEKIVKNIMDNLTDVLGTSASDLTKLSRKDLKSLNGKALALKSDIKNGLEALEKLKEPTLEDICLMDAVKLIHGDNFNWFYTNSSGDNYASTEKPAVYNGVTVHNANWVKLQTKLSFLDFNKKQSYYYPNF